MNKEVSRLAQPVRLQLRRSKGFRLQECSMRANGLMAVKVDRTGPFGNPFRVEILGRSAAVEAFRRLISGEMPDSEIASHSRAGGWRDEGRALKSVRDEIRRKMGTLRGKNLGCWCHPDHLCHGDVLLQFANSPGLKIDQVQRLKYLEEENSRLKGLVTGLSFEKQVLSDIAKRGS